jgi:hypothetical protein
LKNTINSLKQNEISINSKLYIFSDGPKNKAEIPLVLAVRDYLSGITGFESITIKNYDEHKGLAVSIIEGVSHVINIHKKVIVLEDDLELSSNFLEYMNQSLHQYENNEQVFSISGYAFDLDKHTDLDGYFLNRAWSWGWATWYSRWNAVDWEVTSYKDFKINKPQKKRFALLGSDVNLMLKRQMNRKLDSWLIRFIYHQFKVGGLTLYPTVSKVINNGWDKYATHNKGLGERFATSLDNTNNSTFLFPNEIKIHHKYQHLFLRKNSLSARFYNKIKELLLLKFKEI